MEHHYTNIFQLLTHDEKYIHNYIQQNKNQWQSYLPTISFNNLFHVLNLHDFEKDT